MDGLATYALIKDIGIGGSFVVFLLGMVVIEVSPIHINPIAWIGKKLNKDTLDKVKEMNSKLDEHIAQSYRNKILTFQDDILCGKNKTLEQWKEVINAITAYEKYCNDNNIKNGLCKQASVFLDNEYKERLKTRNFAPAVIKVN